MASSTRSSYTLLFSAAVLLSVLAAAAAARTNWCEPGLVIPLNPLPSCRSYLVRRACGIGRGRFVPLPVLKSRCCKDLEDVVPYCRCSALRTMIDGMSSAMGFGGGAEIEMRGTCSWGGVLELAPTLVSETECNLRTIHGRPYCNPFGSEATTTTD